MMSDTHLPGSCAACEPSNKEIFLIKTGELVLKGLNKSTFESILLKNLRYKLKPLGEFKLRKAQSTIYVEPVDSMFDMDEAGQRISEVFGIAAFSRAVVTEKNMDAILKAAENYLYSELASANTFKVEAKRSDKTFELESPEICRQAGAYLLDRFSHLKVDVHNPDVMVVIEIRDFGAYIHGRQLVGAGGMPVGSGGKAALLISGGIDSPVAGYMMAKRGIELLCIHFVSPPYTSERAELKVVSLLERLSRYTGNSELYIVPFTHIQEQIRQNCPEDLFTIIMRRFMMRIATMIADRFECGALVTGESVGQVASQTIPAIACTDAASGLPVFRPLIGMDKDEIVTISRKIDTFDISIQPYQDCCTVFTPRHPRTRPRLEKVLMAEEALDADKLIDEAISGIRKRPIRNI
ncbi:MAG: tRNA 4-thiouridine(8) synthase ThiI [Oscillospiraceae bacterium]|jgi:thiamine biosynthesis protein ThiI|nr:tRNA 4-thiouridine(8) synthase ThiI [Oscillospiraceae bacterium]